MLKRVKRFFIILKSKIYDYFKIPQDWTILRRFDFNRAEKFFQEYQNDLEEMSLCMGFDENVWEPIVEGGKLIAPPCCYTDVSGVVETLIDVPCIFYRFKSGICGKFECDYVFVYSPKYGQIRGNLWDIAMNTRKFRPFESKNYPNLESFQKEYLKIN